MWNWILSDESYIELYHQYFTEFLNTVDVQAIIDNAYDLIKAYVEKDPTAFCTYEEFETGVEAMRQFCALRSESISMQLANGNTSHDMSYVDASALTLSDMGSMNMGGGMPNRGGNNGGLGRSGLSDGTTALNPDADRNNFADTHVQGASASASEDIPQNSEMSALPEGFDPSQIPGNQPSTNGRTEGIGSSGGNMQMPGGSFNPNRNDTGNTISSSTSLIWLAVSVLILAAGLIVAKIYRF